MPSPPKSKIEKEHVKEAARIWREQPGWGGFHESTTYDVKIGGGRYPPKAICAIANKLATGERLQPGDFPGAFDGAWHRVLTGLKFKIIPKAIDASESRQAGASSIIDFRDDPRFDECGRGLLVTGKPLLDKMNREFLRRSESGHWIFAEGREAEAGDALFVLLPHPTGKGGYPRELHAGVLKARPKRDPKSKSVVFSVKKFHELGEIDAKIREFLGGKVPPEGNTVLTLWDDDEALEALNPGGGMNAAGGGGDEEEEYPEGKERYKLHRSKERSRKLIKRAKALRLQSAKKLACDVCSFDFGKTYGPRGAGYIEGHHTIPVSELTGKTRSKVSQIALVCANCHRMLHLMKPLPSIEQLRTYMEGVRKAGTKSGAAKKALPSRAGTA